MRAHRPVRWPPERGKVAGRDGGIFAVPPEHSGNRAAASNTLAGMDRPSAAAGRLSKLLVAGATVTALAFVGLLVAIAQWLLPDPLGLDDDSHPRPTDIVVFDPTLAAESTPGDAEVSCAASSLRSARVDAHLCLLGERMILDPCFDAGPKMVACPRVERNFKPSDQQEHFAVDRVTPFFFDTLENPRMGIDTVTAQSVPWAIQLGGRLHETICYVAIAEVAERLTLNDSTTYLCGPDVMMVRTPAAFVSGEDRVMWAFEPRFDGTASVLNRSDAIWTVQYGPPGSAELSRVEVARAWF